MDMLWGLINVILLFLLLNAANFRKSFNISHRHNKDHLKNQKR